MVLDQVDGALPLTELAGLPFDEVRVGASRIAALESDPEFRDRLQKLGEFSHQHQAALAVDGVADESQLGLLLDLGVSRIQGPLVGSAQPLSDLFHWLEYGPAKLRQYGLEVLDS